MEETDEKPNSRTTVRHRVDPILKDYLKRRRDLNLKVWNSNFHLGWWRFCIRSEFWSQLWTKIYWVRIFFERSFSCHFFEFLHSVWKLSKKYYFFKFRFYVIITANFFLFFYFPYFLRFSRFLQFSRIFAYFLYFP